MSPSYHVLAPAKVNLRLKVVGRRADGFHDLSMLNASLDLSDKIAITLTSGPKISTGSVKFGELISEKMRLSLQSELLFSSNLIVKTATHCRNLFKLSQGVSFDLEKNIPVGAGLGGGSSDAAAVARFFFEKFGAGYDKGQFARDLVTLGSDVPFCFYGKPAWVGGVGEVVRPLPGVISEALKGQYCLLLLPEMQIPSVEVYKEYREKFPEIRKANDPEMEKMFTTAKSRPNEIFNQIKELSENDLENSLPLKFSLVSEFLIKIRESGIRAAMSGSGSSLVVFSEKSNIDANINRLAMMAESLAMPVKIKIARFQ